MHRHHRPASGDGGHGAHSLSVWMHLFCIMAFYSVNIGILSEYVPNVLEYSKKTPECCSDDQKGGDLLFKLKLAEYINSNMHDRGMTYKRLEQLSGVPQSSLHAYAQGRVANPDEDNLIRIAVAFGDEPEIIQQMRRESLDSTVKENQLFAESGDKKRMDEFALLMRSNMAAMLEEYRLQSAAQQTEIIQHADTRVETEKQRFKARADEVLRQCNEEIGRIKEDCAREIELNKRFCDERIALTEKHYEARLEDQRRHMEQLAAKDDKHGGELRDKNARSIDYLQSSVRNLSGSCILLIFTTLFFGAYAIFAYTTFDMADLSRGLHRGGMSIGPVLLALSVALVAVAGSRIVILFFKRPKNKGGSDL